MTITPAALQELHDRLLRAYGPQHWWPAASRFEILVGAVLVQRTTWKSAAQAIERLRTDHALTAPHILAHADLPGAIRAAGPHRVKAERLRVLCRWFVAAGGFAALRERSTAALRSELLALKGIGPETADVILLYAFERPQFVADAYAFRILRRYGWIDEHMGYERLRRRIEAAGPAAAPFYNELHALLVAHAQSTCHKRRPTCRQCALRSACPQIGVEPLHAER